MQSRKECTRTAVSLSEVKTVMEVEANDGDIVTPNSGDVPWFGDANLSQNGIPRDRGDLMLRPRRRDNGQSSG